MKALKINEIQNFQRGGDPKDSLGVGITKYYGVLQMNDKGEINFDIMDNLAEAQDGFINAAKENTANLFSLKGPGGIWGSFGDIGADRRGMVILDSRDAS